MDKIVLLTVDVSLAFTIAGIVIGLIFGNYITSIIIKSRGKHDRKNKRKE